MRPNRHALLLSLLALLLPAGLAVADDTLIPLHNDWRLQSSARLNADGAALSMEGLDASAWYPTTVPKTVLAALAENEVFPDPYFGLNLKDIPGYKDGLWHVMAEDSPFRNPWWYRNEFILPASAKGRQVTLHLDGLNYQANIWLNGKLVAGADTVKGMFRRFEFNVTEHLHPGKANALAVEIIPPGLVEDKRYNTKQIEATTGWDDHNPQPPDMNMGFWQPVYLRVQGPVSLRHPYVETKLATPGLESARLTLSAYLRNNTAAAVSGTFTTSMEGRTLSQKVDLAAGETREVFFRPEDHPELVIQNPRVWWPHPVGPQELYDMDFAFAVDGKPSDAEHVRFGIREITTAIDPDDWRYYMVNGQKILIRGGAWMNSDMMMNLSHDRYNTLVRYAREGNLNMLRSEGFSIRETADFYNLCDELGVMVTQQLFGRSIPDEELAIACIDDTFLRIRNHPSLAHFLGHDETFPTETLDAAYRGLIEKYRVNRTYQPHSGTFTIRTRDKTGGTRTGTRELWTYAGPSHYYFTERKHDVAWGFAQSGGIGGIVAVRDSLRQMMPEDQLWPAMKTEAWSFHTVTQGADYFDAVLKAMDAQYGPPSDLDDFCDKIYAMNYNSARGMYEAYAKNRYAATGITTWKYNAAWPAAMTWQYVDWYGRATAAYYGAKKACTPVHALYAYNDNTVYVTNSYYAPETGLNVSATLYNMDGTKAAAQKNTVDVGADSVVKAFAVEVPDGISDPYFLKLELTGPDGAPVSDNFYWLSKTPDIPGRSMETLSGTFQIKPKSQADYKALASLPPVTLEQTATQTRDDNGVRLSVMVTNPTSHVAFLVQIAAKDPATDLEIGPTFWSENYFSLLPGEQRTVSAAIPDYAFKSGEAVIALTAFNM
ncbi:MAG: hypothetical protein H3C30_19190 [Candidatus Hydrogenedentes bacterium]|nr:hypothetical protein [Candidatus Hydrogenedentota bacterium]